MNPTKQPPVELVEKYTPLLETYARGNKTGYIQLKCAQIAVRYADELSPKWISCKEQLPKEGEKVLIVIDVRKWDANRKRRIECANVGRFENPTEIGGPRSLTGYSMIEGIYFAVPAILHPDSVTHWRPLPDLPDL